METHVYFVLREWPTRGTVAKQPKNPIESNKSGKDSLGVGHQHVWGSVLQRMPTKDGLIAQAHSLVYSEIRALVVR